jgi:hypothetical protein
MVSRIGPFDGFFNSSTLLSSGKQFDHEHFCHNSVVVFSASDSIKSGRSTAKMTIPRWRYLG